MTVKFQEMIIYHNLGLHETGYIIYGEPFLSIRTNKEILPYIRRVMPAIIAKNIIGVSPIMGSVGQIFTLRTRYKC